MVVSLLLIGIYFLFGDSWGVSSLFLLVFFLFYVFCCAVSICAVVFVLLSEMYPTKVRGLAMSIAGFALWIGTYLIGQLTPWMLQNLPPEHSSCSQSCACRICSSYGNSCRRLQESHWKRSKDTGPGRNSRRKRP